MSFGSNLKRLRKDKGFSQDQLSKISGIKVAHISRLETKVPDPKLSTIYKLMTALECSADGLLVDKNQVGMDSILKTTLERAGKLPEENKRHIIDVVDKYCIAVGMEQQFSEQNTNWGKRFILGGPVEKALPDDEAT